MILFDNVIFGPVLSRRLGISLGINLLPDDRKYCNFNCVYCECGLSFGATGLHSHLPPGERVKKLLTEKLDSMKSNHEKLDAITFAGNGEPSIHPEFSGIIDDAIDARDLHYPEAVISVLSNSSMLHHESVFNALAKIEKSILKLDSAIESTIKKINRPPDNFDFKRMIESLKKFHSKLILQTLFTRGWVMGETIDNTTEAEISEWVKLIDEIRPKQVQIYSIHRMPPYKELEMVPAAELEKIADRIRGLGIDIFVAK